MPPRTTIVRGAVPRASIAAMVVLAWAQAAALTLVAVGAGGLLDALARGGGAAGPATAIGVGVACSALAAAGDALLVTAAQNRAERIIRTEVVASVHREGIGAAQHSGELLSLATDFVERATRYRGGFLGSVIGSFTTPLVVLLVFGALVDGVIALWLALMIVVVPLIVMIAQRLVRRSGSENRREKARLASAFLTSVQGLGTLASLRAAQRQAGILSERGERYRRTIMRMLARNQLLILVIDASVSLGIVLVAVLLAATRLGAGELSGGQALAALLVALLVIRPVDLVGAFFYIGIAGRAAERALLARLERFPAPPPGPREPGEAQSPWSDILIDRVDAAWTAGRPVLTGFSLRVAEGESVALVGPSGSGKSTVSALVQGDLGVTAGVVRVAGRDPRRTRPRLAVVEQRTFLFQGTIGDNLRLADDRADDHALWRALAAAGLEDEVREMEGGLDTPVGEHGLTLSGGQAQRLAIARAVLRDAPILLLDEPTSHVDLAGESAFLRRLDGLARGRTVLMIAHRPGAILAADRIIRMSPETTR